MIEQTTVSTARHDTSTPAFRFNMGFIWMISLVAAMGGLLFGYDWVVIGGAKPFFERFFELTSARPEGWANSCALIGCLVGAMVAGALSDRFGRKRLLMASALIFIGHLDRQRSGAHLLDVRLLAHARRRRHRAGLQPLADVHRRDRPGPACGAGWWPSTS